MYPRCSLATGVLALLAAFPSLTVLAAEQALPTVVVTATRQPQRSNELLADVSTISREDIEAAGVDGSLRPEQLDLAAFVRLADRLAERGLPA